MVAQYSAVLRRVNIQQQVLDRTTRRPVEDVRSLGWDLACLAIGAFCYLAIRFVEATLDPMRRRQILDLEIVKPPLGSGLYLREYFLID